jgi:hypothetical protein
MTTEGTSRRRLLRDAAVAGAGLGGVGAAVVAATPASAATGQNIVLGQVNDAGDSPTSLSSTAPITLHLKNPSGSTLGLGDRGTYSWPSTALGVGTIQAPLQGYGELEVERSAAAPRTGQLYNERIAVTTVPVTPTRVLDTRNSAGRAHIVYVAGSINNSTGVVAARSFLVVALDHMVRGGEGVRMNVTVAKTGGRGYLTVWGRGNLPTAASLNWWGANMALSNTVMSQLGYWDDSHRDVIAIYNAVATAIVVDVQAFYVSVPWRLASWTGFSPAATRRPGAQGQADETTGGQATKPGLDLTAAQHASRKLIVRTQG